MSLLLESLKKAALEKKEREKYSEPPQVNPQIQSSDSILITDSQHERHQQPPAVKEEIELEFNIDEVEFIPDSECSTHSDDASVDAPTAIERSHAIQSGQETNKPIEASHTPTPTPTPLADESLANHNISSSRFTPESGKAALATLMEKNNQVAKSNRMRRHILTGILLTTGLIVLGSYYYFLQDSSQSLSPLNSDSIYVHQPDNDSNTEASYIEASHTTSSNNETHLNEQAVSDPLRVESNEKSRESRTESIADPIAVNSNQYPIEKKSESKLVAEAEIDTPIKNPTQINKPDQKSLPVQKSASVESRAIESFIQSHPKTEDIVAQQVGEAYRAYQQGQLSQADAIYQEVLLQDAYNRDAILGLAAIAIRQGNTHKALDLYQQQLERDPQDEYAISGIMSLNFEENNIQLLSDVNRLLEANPNAVHLLVLKGRLLASQKQWLPAQEIFFNAWQYDKHNADIAYNLAVCLDHLAQAAEAIRFYQMALALKNPNASFSSDIVEKRIASLLGTSP